MLNYANEVKSWQLTINHQHVTFGELHRWAWSNGRGQQQIHVNRRSHVSNTEQHVHNEMCRATRTQRQLPTERAHSRHLPVSDANPSAMNTSSSPIFQPINGYSPATNRQQRPSKPVSCKQLNSRKNVRRIDETKLR